MRRRLYLTMTAVVLAGAAATAGVAHASAAAPRAVPHTTVNIVAGSQCTPAASFCFKPSAKTIASGTRVIWKNTTAAPHTITRCTPAACSGVSGGTGHDTGFGSGTVSSGGRYKFVFHGTGTYTYYCTIHGYALMHGTITVT